jgi:hypothetical protein
LILNISCTRAAKLKAQEYTVADYEMKKSIKKENNYYIEELVSQAEYAAQGNLKDLYLTTKKHTCKFQQTHKPVKDKDGNSPSTEEQLKRRSEHFRELLNHCTPGIQPDIPPAETKLPINCDKPCTAEIRKTITTSRIVKQEPDNIPAEVIKADTEIAVTILRNLFNKICEK